MISSTTTTQVVVRFTVNEGSDQYTDALYFTPDEHSALSDKDIEVLQQERYDNWKAIVTAPRPEPTPEEIAQQKTDLAQQFISTKAQLMAVLNPDEQLAFDQGREVVVAAEIAALEPKPVDAVAVSDVLAVK
jgi:hypothetical protein